MNKLISLVMLSAAALMAQPQLHDMIKFEQLAPKASKTVEVNLDGNMLSFVRNFLSDSKKDEAEAKRIIGKLKGIYVRQLEFDKEGEYNEADIEQLRKQVSGPGWQKRPCLSRSVKVNRQTPPFGVAPICASSINESQSRSPLIRSVSMLTKVSVLMTCS